MRGIFLLLAGLLVFFGYVAAADPEPSSQVLATGGTKTDASQSVSRGGRVSPRPSSSPASSSPSPTAGSPRKSTRTPLKQSRSITPYRPEPTNRPPPLIPPQGGPNRRPPHQGPPAPFPVTGHSSKKLSVVAIVFVCLGSVAAALATFALVRCFYNWRRTPGRDRIAGLLDRHHLQREMEELERAQMERRVLQRGGIWRPPPPPYQPAPEYDAVAEPPPPPPPPPPANV